MNIHISEKNPQRKPGSLLLFAQHRFLFFSIGFFSGTQIGSAGRTRNAGPARTG